MSEEEIQRHELEVPLLAGKAFAEARERVLSSGHTIVESENGILYEVHPNGCRVEIKRIDPRIEVVAGEIIKFE